MLLREPTRGDTLGARVATRKQRDEIERKRREAHALLQEALRKQRDLNTAATHPPTQYTTAAWGARTDEPCDAFPRALRRTLLELNVPPDMADLFVRASTLGGDISGVGSVDAALRVNGKGEKGKSKIARRTRWGASVGRERGRG